MAVTLREITEEDREAVLALRTTREQERFVSTVADSLEEAADHPEGAPWIRAVYEGDEPVGFVMLSWDVVPRPPDINGPWFLWKLLVDHRHQRRGIGREVVQQVVELVRAHGAEELLTSYVPGDGGPAGFYARLGFVPTGELDPDGEVLLRKTLREAPVSRVPSDEQAVHRLLTRLDDLARVLGSRGDVVAVLGLGSAGLDRHRLDAHSDLDVFVVVDDAAVAAYRSDPGWWGEVAPVAFAFAHTHDGWKVLFEDGVFVESAVFSLRELDGIPFTRAAVVWARDDAPPDVAVPRKGPAPDGVPSDAHQVGEALTNLFVGLHRLARGEVLSATRLIQSHAVDRVLTLLERRDPTGRRRQDPFAVERGAESQHAGRDLPLGDMVAGYAHNRGAAAAVLQWLRRNVPDLVDPRMAAAVDDLLARAAE